MHITSIAVNHVWKISSVVLSKHGPNNWRKNQPKNSVSITKWPLPSWCSAPKKHWILKIIHFSYRHPPFCDSKTPFLGRTQNYENMVIFQAFVAEETRIIRKLFIFNFFFIKKVEIDNAKFVFLLELVVIINKSWYNQVYISLIIELWSPISTFFDQKIKK